jgi:hypothetical protein
MPTNQLEEVEHGGSRTQESDMTSMTELSNILWHQRRRLEELLYRLDVQQLVLAAGRSRWISRAATDVETVIEQIRSNELTRAVHLASVASELGLVDTDLSLRELIAAASPPWDAILREHHEAFITMTSEIDEITRHNTELLNRGYQATRDYLAALGGMGGVDGYSATGAALKLSDHTHRLDKVLG